jgi:hypothetical protein
MAAAAVVVVAGLGILASAIGTDPVRGVILEAGLRPLEAVPGSPRPVAELKGLRKNDRTGQHQAPVGHTGSRISSYSKNRVGHEESG